MLGLSHFLYLLCSETINSSQIEFKVKNIECP